MKFKEGSRVEVMRNKEEQYDSWYPAKILFVHGSTYTVGYELFLASNGKPMVETVHEQDVRPYPPPLSNKEWWIIGDIAEALDVYSWRAGKVVKVLKNDRVVMKLFGSILLKEHHAFDLRVPQAWQNNQWITVDKGSGGKQFCYDYIHYSSNCVRKFDYGTNQGIGKQALTEKKSKKKHVGCSSPIRTVKRDLDSHCGFSLIDLVRGIDRKRKSSTDTSHRLSGRALPKRVDAVSFAKVMVNENSLHKSSKRKIARHSQMNAKENRNNRAMNSSSIPLPVTEENNECSIASCSGNEYPGYTYEKLRKCSKDTSLNRLDDAMSSCPLEGGKDYQNRSGDDLAANVHELELHAYKSTVQALHASGTLSWEQESLLTNLRLSLNISNEEHLLHLRKLLSS